MAEEVKKDEEKNVDKPFFFQRLVSYVIDMFIIAIVSSLIYTPFMNTEKTEKLQNQQIEIMEKFQNQEIDASTYLSEYSDVYYKTSRNNGFLSIITIVLKLGYFVVLPIYLGGQTLGKKFMKIKIESTVDSLTSNQLLFRSFIVNFTLLNFIEFILMIFSPKDIFFLTDGLFSIIQYIIMFISLLMIIISKDGSTIHDKIARTRVVSVK